MAEKSTTIVGVFLVGWCFFFAWRLKICFLVGGLLCFQFSGEMLLFPLQSKPLLVVKQNCLQFVPRC